MITNLTNAESWEVVKAGIRALYGDRFEGQTVKRISTDYLKFSITPIGDDLSTAISSVVVEDQKEEKIVPKKRKIKDLANELQEAVAEEMPEDEGAIDY